MPVLLCFTLFVPALLTAGDGGPEITLEKTVGIDPGVCGTVDALEVTAGTEVTYCYTATNTGDSTFNSHDLEDDVLGTLLDDFFFPMDPGDTSQYLATFEVLVDTTNTATWAASLLEDADGVVTTGPPDFDTDSATVTVVPAEITLMKTVGTVAATCATTTDLEVEAGTTVHYCYKVTNESTVTYVEHDLVDDQLGPILADFALTLAPGEMAQIIQEAVITEDTVNTATWTARTLAPRALRKAAVMAQAQGQANVQVMPAVPAMGWPWLVSLGVLFALGGVALLRQA